MLATLALALPAATTSPNGAQGGSHASKLALGRKAAKPKNI